jgi:hypothetical protein
MFSRLMSLVLFVMTISSVSAQQFQQSDLHRVHWLLGKWRMASMTGDVVETWQMKDDTTFVGWSYKLKPSGDTTILENVELVYRNGQLKYIPTAIGQNNNKPVEFRFTALTEDGFVAENPSHDFPQKIQYELKTGNILSAVVSGKANGSEKKEVFEFLRE